jgi:hypothetical protein
MAEVLEITINQVNAGRHVENCPHSKVTVCTEDTLVPLLELVMPSVEVNVEYNQRSCCKTSQ